MRRLNWGKSFARSYTRAVKRDPLLADQLERVLDLLSHDPFTPSLETHKLKGELAGMWACSAGYDVRVIFVFRPSQSGGEDDIILIDIGTHDEVY